MIEQDSHDDHVKALQFLSRESAVVYGLNKYGKILDLAKELQISDVKTLEKFLYSLHRAATPEALQAIKEQSIDVKSSADWRVQAEGIIDELKTQLEAPFFSYLTMAITDGELENQAVENLLIWVEVRLPQMLLELENVEVNHQIDQTWRKKETDETDFDGLLDW